MCSFYGELMHLDTAFTELRSVLNHRQLSDGDRAKIWSLIQQSARWNEAAYLDQWMPYLSAFTQHWQQPLTHLKTQHAILRAMRLCPFARFTFAMKTRHLVYSDVWFEQVDWSMFSVDLHLSQYTMNEGTIEHIVQLPKLPRIRQLHANDQGLTTKTARRLLMWADGSFMESLAMANNNLDVHIAETLNQMQAKETLIELNLRNSGLGIPFQEHLDTTSWPALRHFYLW